MQQFTIARDPVFNPTYSIPQSDVIYALSLSANTESEVTVLGNARYVIFSATDDFYYRFDASGAISVPSTDIEDGSAPELNPGIRTCKDVTAISIISDVDCVVTLSFYS